MGVALGAVVLFLLGGLGASRPTILHDTPRRTAIVADGVTTTLHLENLRREGRASVLPAMTEFAGMVRVSADSSIKLGSKVTLEFPPLAAGDTVLYQYYRNDTLITGLSKRLRVLADSSFVPAPAYSTTTVFKGCATIERGGRLSGVKSTRPCWTWSFVRGAPPPSILKLDRLAIYGVPLVPGGPWARRSLTAAVSDSNQCQFCAYGILSDLTWVEADNTALVPVCDSVFAVRLSERRV